jgi:hypothetical protein
MIGAGIKGEFYQYVHNTELTPFIADKCIQHYNLTSSFTKKFKYHSHDSRVSFYLYDRAYAMPLEEFCGACKIPYWGSLDAPPKTDYEMFLSSLCCGEDRVVTQARIKSIQFPSIRYFALFNGKCIMGKQDCITLCAPDLSLIGTALTGIKRYNLGAIVARRLQRNADSGHFYGGIYTSRVAARLGVSPLPNDPILPDQYLDFDAMQHHKFIKYGAQNYNYNLMFDKKNYCTCYFACTCPL